MRSSYMNKKEREKIQKETEEFLKNNNIEELEGLKNKVSEVSDIKRIKHNSIAPCPDRKNK